MVFRKQVTSIGSFVMGWLAGALAGAIAGLLLAPRSGVETQLQIKRQAESARNEADKAVNETAQRARGMLDGARESIASQIKQGAEIVEP